MPWPMLAVVGLLILALIGAGAYIRRLRRQLSQVGPVVLAAMNEAAVLVAADGRTRAHNQAFASRYGNFLNDSEHWPVADFLQALCDAGLLNSAQRRQLLEQAAVEPISQVVGELGQHRLDVRQLRLPNGDFVQCYTALTATEKLEAALRENSRQGQTLLELLPIGVVVSSMESSQILFANQRMAEQLGFEAPGEVVGQLFSAFYAQADERAQVLKALADDGSVFLREVHMRDKLGRSWWHLVSAHLTMLDGVPVIFSAGTNITQQKETEAALRASEQKLYDLLDTSPSASFIFDAADERILFHNGLARQLLGGDKASLLGQTVPGLFLNPQERDTLIDAARDGAIVERELPVRTPQGEVRWFYVSARMVEFAGRSAIFCSMLDIHARRQAELQLRLAREETERVNRQMREVNLELEQLASTDRLTQAFNRRHFEELALREMSRARRYNTSLALIMIDLDHFKAINDDFGHAAGDRVLVEFARLARQKLRSSDVFARWGGEEFIVLATSTALDEAAALAEKLRELMCEHQFEGLRPVTLSAGVTALSYTDTLDGFVLRADTALYQAKSSGRNCVVALAPDTLIS